MSKIDELIAEMCPDGVEWKSIGEVCDTITDYVAAGSFADVARNVKYNTSKDSAQLVRTTDLKSNFSKGGFVYVSENAYKFLWRVDLNRESIVLPNIGNCGEVYYVTPDQLPHPKNVLGPNAILLRSDKCSNKFITYCFDSETFRKDLQKITSQTGQTKFNKTELKKLRIPIPPLKVQQKIVQVLDSFTTLEVQLVAELEARKKQYEYYRNELLCFGDDVTWKTFGEISFIVRGASPRPIQKFITNDETGVNWIKIGDVRPGSKYITSTKEKITQEGANKSRFVRSGDFLLSNSMSFGRPYILKTEGCIHDGWLSISGFEKTFTSDFLYHLLSSSLIQNIMAQRASNGTVQNLNADIVKSLELPVPPIEEQARIVAILDRFDALTNDITQGLPGEIAARRRQYEYYRDKLLIFKEVRV